MKNTDQNLLILIAFGFNVFVFVSGTGTGGYQFIHKLNKLNIILNYNADKQKQKHFLYI